MINSWCCSVYLFTLILFLFHGQVVYCEMQARENSMNDRMQRRLQHLIYPQESGYQHEAGGLMENLRTLKIESSNKK